jgi:ATP-dependent RNA helicase RhlE
VSFNNLQLIEPVLAALQHEGYTTPTPIQTKAIPPILEQRDLLGCAQTGTGKTAAFTIPILQLMHERMQGLRPKQVRPIKALILTPTRELAIQIGESIAAYGRFLKIKHSVIFGGVSQHSQVQALRSGIDILVATPGRLLDLMQQGFVHLGDIEFFVLDEADRMLDMGFVHDVKKVIAKLPAKRQTLFFSATMPAEARQLADMLLTNPVTVAVTPVSSTAELVQQEVYHTGRAQKLPLLLHLLQNPQMDSVLVFVQMKHVANRIAEKLSRAGVNAAAIHGNKSQAARQAALEGFKARKVRVLVATDIAARGIDIDNLAYVVNYELPNVPETYVHRIGRTGRAGASGRAISFCDESEKDFLRDIEKLISKKVPVVNNHPFPPGAKVEESISINEAPLFGKQPRSQNNGQGRRPQQRGYGAGQGQKNNGAAQRNGKTVQPAAGQQKNLQIAAGANRNGNTVKQAGRNGQRNNNANSHRNGQQKGAYQQQANVNGNTLQQKPRHEPREEKNYNNAHSFNSHVHYNNEEAERW